MSLITGKITIWIGIVAQICFSAVFVKMISVNIAGGSDYETILLLGLILALFTALPIISIVTYIEGYSVIGDAPSIVYAITTLCLYNFPSSVLRLIGDILLVWNRYSRDESTGENEKADIESTENQFEFKDKITKE